MTDWQPVPYPELDDPLTPREAKPAFVMDFERDECLYMTAINPEILKVVPSYTCTVRPTIRVIGDAERNDVYVCDGHLEWIRNELSWVRNLRWERAA